MGGVELVEPRVDRRHPLSPIELVSHSPLCQCRHVQLRAAGLLVEIVRKTDVPAGHTQRIHTRHGAVSDGPGAPVL